MISILIRKLKGITPFLVYALAALLPFSFVLTLQSTIPLRHWYQKIQSMHVPFRPGFVCVTVFTGFISYFSPVLRRQCGIIYLFDINYIALYIMGYCPCSETAEFMAISAMLVP